MYMYIIVEASTTWYNVDLMVMCVCLCVCVCIYIYILMSYSDIFLEPRHFITEWFLRAFLDGTQCIVIARMCLLFTQLLTSTFRFKSLSVFKIISVCTIFIRCTLHWEEINSLP